MPGLDGLVEIVSFTLRVCRAKAQDRAVSLRFRCERQHRFRVEDAFFVHHRELDDSVTQVCLFYMHVIGGSQQPILFRALSVPDIDRCQLARLVNGIKQCLAARCFLPSDGAAVDQQLHLVGVGVDLR